MVRLVSVEDGKLLWTGQFDEKFTNVFTVQDSISEQVVRALAVQLTGEEKALFTKHSTQNTEAYQLYLLGRYFWAQSTEEGLTKGIGYFRQAIQADPNYARAYAGLADSYILLGSHGSISMTDSSSNAKEAAAQALRIDEQLGEAHVSMASIVADSWDWGLTEKHYKRAIELIPNDEAAHCWYSQYLADAGRFDEAIGEAKLAQEIAPASRQANHALAYAFYMARRYVEAIEQSRKTLELDPNYPVAHIIIGLAYVQTGMHARAVLALQEARQRSDSPDFLALVGYAHAMAGRKNEARSVLDELMELSKKRYVSSFPVAMIYTGLGETKLAIERLERAIEERGAHLRALRVDPAFDSLRSGPQFAQVLRQMGLSQ
jgi:tetratricopeptide (TPR) repeat protein